jgi:hypothetical protein
MERHEIDKFKSWNFTPPSFEELHGNDVYHSRYVDLFQVWHLRHYHLEEQNKSLTFRQRKT